MDQLPMEKTSELFRTMADQAFLDDPYLDSVAVVFGWKIGNTDMPFGLLLGKEGKLSPATLLNICQQTCKLLMHQSMEIKNMLDAADELAKKLAEAIKQNSEELK